MGRTAHCPARDRALPLWHWAMRTAASSGALRGAIGRARRTDPPSGGLFHVRGRFLARSGAAPYNLHRPVRTPELPTVRALGRAAAAVMLLPAILRRGGAQQSRRAGGTREFESVSRVAERAGAERRRRAGRADAARRNRRALRCRLRGSHARLRRRTGSDRLSRPLGRRRRRLVARPAARPRARAVGNRERRVRGRRRFDGLRHGRLERRQPPTRRADGAKSAAFVPLLVEERVIAVISVATLDEPRVFSPEDLAVMQTLASEAAVALERLRAGVALEEALKRNEEQLAQQSALLRAAHVLSSELDLPVVLQRLADQLAAAPRRRRRRLLPPRPRARRVPLRRGARLRRVAARFRVPDGPGPGRRRRPRGTAADRERVPRDLGRRFRTRPTTASPT